MFIIPPKGNFLHQICIYLTVSNNAVAKYLT